MASIRMQTNNKDLDAPAPRINKTDTYLSRRTMTTGYVTTLNSFLHRIKPTNPPAEMPKM